MITDEECRNVAAELRRQIGYMSERSKWYEDDIDGSECGNTAYRNIAASVERCGHAFQGNYIHIVERLADLIDRPMCRDLVEHKEDPFIPGKRMTDGYFHCSNCDWDGRLWEHIGFGDMLAYEPVHCPKCGEEIKR